MGEQLLALEPAHGLLQLPKGRVDPSLEIVDLSKEFSRSKFAPFSAIRSINAVVENRPRLGEFISIIGPSGCGKSTLLNMVAGFDTHLPATRGNIFFHGKEITGPDPSRGMMSQDYGIFANLDVISNVAFGMRLHREEMRLTNKDITELSMDWISKVNLRQQDIHKYPYELSGGMKQRVALARCLSLKPKCILMDEPCSALDEPTRYEMEDLIVQLWSEIEATILLVSHSIAEAVFLGDRVWIMSDAPGTIAAEFVNVPPPDPTVPAYVQRMDKRFVECVTEVSDCFEKVRKTPRERITPIKADGIKDHLPIVRGF